MNSELKFIELFADGSCSGNPGPGGWGTILRFGSTEKELSGGAKETTNNRMEITAVLEGLRALKYPCRVKITTDSQYVFNSITKGWAESWKKNNWVKKDKKPALNADLWDELLNELEKHEVEFCWIKGHNGHSENERCDALAVAQTEKFKATV